MLSKKLIRLMKNFFRITISFLILNFLTNSVFSQFKVLDDLKKTGDQILKETGSGKGTSTAPQSSPTKPPTSVQTKESVPQQQTKSTMPEGVYALVCIFKVEDRFGTTGDTRRIYIFNDKENMWGLVFSVNEKFEGALGKKHAIPGNYNMSPGYIIAKKEGENKTLIYEKNNSYLTFIEYTKVDFNKDNAQLSRVKRDKSSTDTYEGDCKKI